MNLGCSKSTAIEAIISILSSSWDKAFLGHSSSWPLDKRKLTFWKESLESGGANRDTSAQTHDDDHDAVEDNVVLPDM